MSEASKMGLFGSKEENSRCSAGQSNKDDSPERYAPYSVDSDSETYDTEALSIMDINDIIGVQAEPVGSDSTLESEIAALSQIITDTNLPQSTSEDIINKEITEHSQLITNEPRINTDLKVSEANDKTNENTNVNTAQLPIIKDANEVNTESRLKEVTGISKSLQLIGEAYDSDDSQDSESNEMQIGKEPKIDFSPKPFVEKQSYSVSKNENYETVQNIIIDKISNNSIAIIENAAVVGNVKKEEVEKTHENAVENTVLINNDCKTISNISHKDVSLHAKTIVNKSSDIKQESSYTCSDFEEGQIKEHKSVVKSEAYVVTDLLPSTDDDRALPDNQNHAVDTVDDVMIINTDHEINSIGEEVNIKHDKPTNDDEMCTMTPPEIDSESDPEHPRKLDEKASSQSVNIVDENNALKVEKTTMIVIDERAPLLVQESETVAQSESTAILSVTKKEEQACENSMTVNKFNTNDVICIEGISKEICKAVLVKKPIPIPPVGETNETAEIDKPSINETEIISDNRKLADVERMQEDTFNCDGRTETIENPIRNEDYQCDIEEPATEALLESEEVTQPKYLEECADSSTEFVDALSPAHFPAEGISGIIEEQKSETGIIERMNMEVDDKEKSLDFADNVKRINDTKVLSNVDTNFIHDQTFSEQDCTTIMEAIPDSNLNTFEGKLIEQVENDTVIDQESLTSSTEMKITQVDNTDSFNAVLPPLSSKSPLASRLSEQIFPESPSANLESIVIPAEDDAIEFMNVNKSGDKTSELRKQETDIAQESNLSNSVQPIENISDTVTTVSNLESILEHQEVQNDENDITESVPILEEITSTASKVINDIKENFISPPNELLEDTSKDQISVHTDDSLDGILDLDLIPSIDDTEMKCDESIVESVIKNVSEEMDTIEKESSLELLLPDAEIASVNQTDDFLNNVIDTLHESKNEAMNTNCKMENEQSIKVVLPMDKQEQAVDDEIKLRKDKVQENLPMDTDNIEQMNLNMPFALTQEGKLDIPDDILNDPLTAVGSGIEVLQVNTEISELESAVKFLQESEDHEIELPPVLPLKIIEDIADEINQRDNTSTTYLSNQDICEDSSDLVAELDTITTESITISEAEIISEAAKLESEKKLNEDANEEITQQLDVSEENKTIDDNKNTLESQIVNENIDAMGIHIDDAAIKATQSIFPVKSSIIPKMSILEERLKEPPKIEIPVVDLQRLCDMPTTPKTSLLIPRDSRIANYQRMMESPKSSLEKSSRDEIKATDTPRRESEKHDIENVGSPRIILKIAKSALADCAEPRSPKSPKIRSATNSPNPEDSPGQKLGKIKLKLSKGGHPSIIPNDNADDSTMQWHTEGSSSLSPLGMKIKLSKSGDASILQHEMKETPKHMFAGSPRRTESPLGMKIKLSRSGDASIIPPDKPEDETNRDTKVREKSECSQDTLKRTDSPLGMKIKFLNTGDASIVSSEYDESKDAKIKDKSECFQDNQKRADSHMGMKIKLSKKGGASIVSTSENNEKIEMPKSPRRTESPLGMKIKLSKTGDASIIHSELLDDQIIPSSHESIAEKEGEVMSCPGKKCESSIGMKIKFSKDGDATIVHSEKQQEDEQQDNKRIDSTIGMKIKFSKSGDASIIQSQTTEGYDERSEVKPHKSSDTTVTIESMKIRLSKTGHGTIVANESDMSQKSKEFIDTHHIFSQKREQLVNRSEVTIEPVQLAKRSDLPMDISPKRKDSVTLSPIEMKKPKIDTKLSQILPEVTIQPVAVRDQKPINFEQSNSSVISRQQINVINQEISITQLKPNKSTDLSVSEKLRKMLTKPPANTNEECEVIGHHPELIIVNENSNSSQDIMIIEEVPVQVPDAKTPKKRGRPRRTAVSLPFQQPEIQMPPDPLSMGDMSRQMVKHLVEPKENERPRRTCRSQKSYAPPKRGRGRGRGKRKFDKIESPVGKKPRLAQNFTAMENYSAALITLDDEPSDQVPNSSELYKALRQPLKGPRMDMLSQNPTACTVALKDRVDAVLEPRLMSRLECRDSETTSSKTNQVQLISDQLKKDSKDAAFGAPNHQNWLTPSSKKYLEMNRNDGISTVQVIDEETRMSAELFSRSQTPARNISVTTAETILNEESQGSVLSTATTESEKVKVKNRRMEISFDPDEGPFTVDKIAEYEWPVDRKGETFMIQEQISQYLGVKSFKRKYPDLKRRMVDMEERNYLRENGLVSEAMCDMGLTAICSSEVLDIMCSDFPDQYEEYRKHMREKQIKEHSKKQKELSAAATAEKNRIDLAEMAVQSALSWNVNLNKARRESRRCSLDLQTFTIHVPQKLQKIEEESKISHYPVALIPGQYTDYYREYTPAELRYYPLNTVLYGPMRPNERKFDSQSEGSQSDSYSDSSSDESSCSSSEGTQDTEESQSTLDDVDIELSNQKDKSLKCKMCLKNLNKSSKSEVLIQCGTCSGHVHPSCIDLTLDMVPHIQAYSWQCTDCKTCVQCHDPADEDKMLFCDMCDRGYHIYCVGLRRVPQGRWHCQECAICASCGSREAGGVNADRNSVALWQHEYKKGDKNTRIYVSTLCVPCSKLWRKGRYCPHCSRCHTVPRLDMEENLVHCSACDKYLHLECVESKDLIIDRKNYQCDLCIQNRQRIVKSSASKVIRA